MIKQCRQSIISEMWQQWKDRSSQMQRMEIALAAIGVPTLFLDHFAIIDLPGPNTGIYHLKQIFSELGFVEHGHDYLPDKQNDFLWLAEADCAHLPATQVLPQVVVADFRPDEMPIEVRTIVDKYAREAMPTPVFNVKKLAEHVRRHDGGAMEVMKTVCRRYFAGRDWSLPTVNDYRTVFEFNELLAWVLVFGRRPNHFTLSVHLLEQFANLQAFHEFITHTLQLPLNKTEGVIKGGQDVGIAQGSTLGIPQTVTLADGNVEMAGDFVEFVWRYPLQPTTQRNLNWGEYYSGFISQHANRVIESLFTTED